jgi:hypothetical protein
MSKFIKTILLFALTIALAACTNNDPGPLAGSWKMNGPVPMTAHFRKGESEAMGMIEKVSYEIKGNQVIVTSESGPMKGLAARYTITGPNTVHSEFGTLTRVK